LEFQGNYFTHSLAGVDSFLSDDTILAADGTTDGGCADDTLVAAGDSHGSCPASRDARATYGQLPAVAFGWKNSVVDANTNTLQLHPCFINGKSE
jgi:hypothetical protein